MSRESRIGLAEAAQLLKLPYQDCHRLLLTGVLRGEKRQGRWYVSVDDVKQLITKCEPRDAATEAVEPVTVPKHEQDDA